MVQQIFLFSILKSHFRKTCSRMKITLLTIHFSFLELPSAIQTFATMTGESVLRCFYTASGH